MGAPDNIRPTNPNAHHQMILLFLVGIRGEEKTTCFPLAGELLGGFQGRDRHRIGGVLVMDECTISKLGYPQLTSGTGATPVQEKSYGWYNKLSRSVTCASP